MKALITIAMPIAVIDIGTNTFNLLIAEPQGVDGFATLFRTRTPVKLGRGGITSKKISASAFQRGISALARYRDIIEKHGAEKTIAFATSAVRDAVNGKQFADEAKRKTGIEITIIDGNREAELIWQGVRKAAHLGDEPVLLMDIGGGSTEFLIANDHDIFWKRSFQLGVTRILETFRPSDPLQADDIQRMVQFFDKELSPLFNAIKQFPVHTLAGSAGSFDSFGSLIAHRYYNPAVFNGNISHPVLLSDFHKLHQWLLTTTQKERLTTKGLVKFRAETIVLASLLVYTVINRIPVSNMVISKYSLREGMLCAMDHWYASKNAL